MAEREVLRQLAVQAARDPVDAPRIENLFRMYLEEILGWTRDSNLVARGDLGRLASRHLAESVAALPLLDRLEAHSLIDVGSGGGFPAIPIQIARPALHVTLVESRRRKGLFLRRVVELLGLENATVRIERAERLALGPGGPFDLATARAVAAVPDLLRWMAPVVRAGGHALLFKGSSFAQEILDWEALSADAPGRSGWGLEEIIVVEDRHLQLVVFRRVD